MGVFSGWGGARRDRIISQLFERTMVDVKNEMVDDMGRESPKWYWKFIE